jgi:hypothetical protein
MEKVRITSELTQEWADVAQDLLDDGQSPVQVIRYLKSLGCTPKLAERLVASAGRHVRSRHRGAGMRGVLVGLVLIAAGGAMLFVAHNGINIGKWNVRAGAFYIIAGVLTLSGVVPVLLGFYKMLTGSTVEINAPED